MNALLFHPFVSVAEWFSVRRLKQAIQRGRSSFLLALKRVAWSILECARRTSTFLSCAFREQEDNQATRSFLFQQSARGGISPCDTAAHSG